ncbi:MAG: branched-chain amino acid ABC transporter permease, partial [Clostridiales bacterium]|nr:branched-chain amino acid ABC transporter permease [Clostridiales bacterium]
MAVMFQQLINGLSLGSVYALMAVGYSLVYSIMNFSNFAHGGVIMIGAYIGYFAMVSLGMPFWLAFMVCGLGTAFIAVLLERLVYRPLRNRNAPFLYFIISAMGASIFFENFVIATIGPTFRTYPQVFAGGPFHLGSLSVGRIDVFMIIVAAVGLLVLTLIIEKSKVGLGIRASSYNIKASTLMGVNVNMVIFTIFL